LRQRFSKAVAESWRRPIAKQGSTALAKQADPAWFHRLNTKRFYENQLFALIGLGLLLATASAYAQTGVVKANVPFNFIVAKTQIPAGEYTIHRVATAGSAMTIESSDRN